MDTKRFLLAAFFILCSLIFVSAASAAYSTYNHPAIRIADGKDIDLAGNSIGNGTIKNQTIINDIGGASITNATKISGKNIGNITYANEYGTIQEALDAGAGKTVIFTGNWTNAVDNTVSKNTTLIGRGAKIYDARTGNDNEIFTVGDNVDISGFELVNTAPSADTYLRLIVADNTRNVKVHDNTLDGSNGVVNGDGVYNFSFYNNNVKNTRTGLSLRNIYYSKSYGNRYMNGSDNAIDVGSVYGMNIFNEQVEDMKTTPTINNGLYVDSVLGYLNINGLSVRNVLNDGIQVNTVTSTVDNVTISNCYLSETGKVGGADRGIHLLGTETRYVRNVTIQGCNIQNSGREGILLEYVNDTRLFNNVVVGSGVLSAGNGHGIRADSSFNISVIGNVLKNNTQYGMSFWGSDYIFATNNPDLQQNGAGAVRAIGSNSVFRDNQGASPYNYGNRAASPTYTYIGAGDTYFDTDVSKLCYYNSSAWLQVDDSTTGCS